MNKGVFLMLWKDKNVVLPPNILAQNKSASGGFVIL